MNNKENSCKFAEDFVSLKTRRSTGVSSLHGSLDILATPACNGMGKVLSKEEKVSRFTCPFDSCNYVNPTA